MFASGCYKAVPGHYSSQLTVLLRGVLCLLLLGCLHAYGTASFPVRYNGVSTSLGSGNVTSPQGVAVDLSGNVYIADTSGNRIVKVSVDGTTAALSITGISPSLSGPRGLTIDSAGNLYIADTGNSRIVKVDSAGNGSVVSTPSITLSGPQGVAIDTSGNIFISDTGSNQIVKVTAAGTASVLSTSSGTSLSSLNAPKGIAVDIFGNLYVVDSGANRVIKVTTALVGSTLTTSGTLSSPVAVGVGMNGVVYIADGSPNYRVTVVSTQGDAYDLLLGALNSSLGVPSAIAVSPLGTVYVVDSSGNHVNAIQVDTAGFGHVVLGSSGTPQTLAFTVSGATTLTGVAVYTSGTQNLDFTIAANSGTPCTTGSNGIGCTVNVQFTPTTAGLRRGALVLSYASGSITVPLYGYGDSPVAALSPGVASVVNVGSVSVAQPFQTARDGVGNIYVTSYQNSTVLRIPAGGGSGSTVTIPSLPTPHTLNSPTGLAIDGAGNLFIADYNNSRIVKVTSAGSSKVINIRGLSGNLSFPTTLNFTPNGRLLVSDYGNGRVVLLSPDIYDNGVNDGDGTVGYATAYVLPLGSYTLGSDNSTGVVSDIKGNVYFTDQNSNPGRVIKLDPLGNLSTVSLPSVTLNAPLGVTVDPSQNLYVVDSGNQRVIQQTAGGTTSILKYSGPSLGQFVFGVDVDGGGNVLISDFINNRLVLDNVSQSSLAFPSTRQGTTSSAKVTTVSNLGNLDLTFSANPTYTANFSIDASDTNPCTSATTLVPGTSCDVPVIFSPQSVGNLSANITVTNDTLNVGGSTQLIAVSGTSTNPGDVTTTTKLSPAATSYSYGQPLTVSVKVQDQTNASAIPTGTVTFTDSLTSTITSKSLDGTGTATLLNNGLLSGIGAHNIFAQYGGVSGSYQGSSTTINITISKNSVSITGPTAVSVVKGQTGSAAISVAPDPANGAVASGTALPSGTISYSIMNGNTTVVAPTSAALTAGASSSSATAAIPSTLASGSYSLNVSYVGDGNYQTGSITIPLTVGQITPTITWNPASSVVYGTNLGGILTASASSSGTSVPGTFSYTAAPTAGSTISVNSSTVLGAGAYVLTATFTPTDATTYTTQTSTASLTVNKAASSTALITSNNPAIIGGAIVFTATVSSASGVPTGTVNFLDGSTLLGTGTIAQGKTSFSTSALAVGTHTIQAVYAGDGNFTGSTSASVAQLVQDITISTPTTPGSTDGAPTATVTPGGTATYTLNIGPSAGTVFVAPVTLSLSGLPPGATGSLSPQSLPAGSSLSAVTLTVQLPKVTASNTSGTYRKVGLAMTFLPLLLLPFAGRMKRTVKSLRGLGCIAVLLFSSLGAIVGLTGCGSSNSGYFGQAEKTYTIYIIATSGSVSRSTSVKLTVQ